MVRVVLYGTGNYYRQNLPQLKALEASGDICVLGVTARDLPPSAKLNGWTLIPREELSALDFDFLFLMVVAYEKEIIAELVGKYGVPRSKILMYRITENTGVDIRNYLSLLQRRITIFVNNCWGGLVSKVLLLEGRSPLKNLWISEKNYLRFLSDPEHYLSIEPVFSKWEKGVFSYEEPLFPCLRLDDLLLHCNHDTDPGTAIEAWNRRAARVNLNDVTAVLITSQPEAEKEFLSSERYQNKYCFTAQPSDDPRVIRMFPGEGETVGDAANHFAENPANIGTLIDMLLGNLHK